MLTRTDGGGIHLRHDHRHEDGSPDPLTLYGGVSDGTGSEAARHFPADAYSKELFIARGIEASVENVWTMEILPGERFTYLLRRPGRHFRADFDLRRPIEPPPAPWGHQGSASSRVSGTPSPESHRTARDSHEVETPRGRIRPSLEQAPAWPAFGGPSGNFVVPWPAGELEWSEAGPRELWRSAIGQGYSGIVGTEERIFVTYLDGAGDEAEDAITALDAEDGRALWSRRFPNRPREGNLVQFGRGPNATPLLLADRVITLGYNGELRAFDPEDGQLLWQRDLVPELEAEVRRWGFSASPIFHGGHVIVAVGGKRHGIAAFDPADGQLAWGGPATSASYATPVVIDVEGRTQLLYFAADALIAVDPENGLELWRHGITNKWSNHSTMPVWASDDLLWVVSQLESGARALRLSLGNDGAPTVEVAWKNPDVQLHYWSSLRLGNTVYSSAGRDGSVLTAVDVVSGRVRWKEKGFPQLNFVHTPAGTLALDAGGTLHLLELSSEGLKVRRSVPVFDADTWTAPTAIGSRLYLRDPETLRTFDLSPRRRDEAAPPGEIGPSSATRP
ncbi:MAG: PQQ-like beta-propeller repeat protein [Holophagales bacterium]|nr:PQQ-like beta-propeller repeat protein [Holophagales bacterium]